MMIRALSTVPNVGVAMLNPMNSSTKKIGTAHGPTLESRNPDRDLRWESPTTPSRSATEGGSSLATSELSI